MNSREIYQFGACSLGNIISDDYSYRPVDDNNHEFLEQRLYPDVYKRKHPMGFYEWEQDDEA